MSVSETKRKLRGRQTRMKSALETGKAEEATGNERTYLLCAENEKSFQAEGGYVQRP